MRRRLSEMVEYKVVNVGGNNLTNRFVDEAKINELAKDGWKLMSLLMPPAAQNNRWVCGTFVRDIFPKGDIPNPSAKKPTYPEK
jgi:hypothetical protein